MKPAIACRTFAFCAGPEHHDFYACEDHQKELINGPDLFLVLPREPIVPVDPEDEYQCWWCQEG